MCKNAKNIIICNFEKNISTWCKKKDMKPLNQLIKKFLALIKTWGKKLMIKKNNNWKLSIKKSFKLKWKKGEKLIFYRSHVDWLDKAKFFNHTNNNIDWLYANKLNNKM